MIFVAGLNYKTAPVELREQLAVNPSLLVSRANWLKRSGNLEEIVLLSTCNRVEIYGTTAQVDQKLDSLFGSLCSEPRDFCAHVYVREGVEAVRHLFQVTTGLDSMILGETEITGQVKKAYDAARGARLTGRTLNRIFQRAFQAVKEIRTRTGIGRGATSVSSVAVELAERVFQHDISKRSVLIIGAGQTGEACLRHLAKKGPRSILVSNRSFDRALKLAGEFNGCAVPFERCLSAMADADIVVASTGSPNTLVHRGEIEELMNTRRDRPLFLIDISVPRNIEAAVQCVDNVYLYNIDDLEAIVRENVSAREQQLTLCNQIIDRHANTLMDKLTFEAPRPNGAHRRFQAGRPSRDAAFPTVQRPVSLRVCRQSEPLLC